MNQEMMRDLKQFISATISLELFDMKNDIKGIRVDIGGLKQDVAVLKQDVTILKHGFKKLDQKVDALSLGIAEAIHDSNDVHDEQYGLLNDRVTKLEHSMA